MSYEVRIANSPDDDPKLKEVWGWIWGGEAPDSEPLRDPFKGELRMLAEVDGQAAGACFAHEYLVARGDADLNCGGVAAVGTLPAYRGKGIAHKMMVDLLYAMRENGQQIAALYAFREKYYRKFGYEVCGWRWQLTVPTERMPRFETTLPTRTVSVDELDQLAPALEDFIRTFSGSVIRRPDQWTRRMGKKPPMVIAVGDPIEGYCWAAMKDFWKAVEVGEIAWSTDRAYEALMGVLLGMAHNQSRIQWCEPPNSRFVARHMDQGVEAKMHECTMFRVLDVSSALKKLKPTSKGEFSVEIHDEYVSENSGCWRVSYSPDGVDVAKSDSADLHLDIKQFSQAFMGSPSISELAGHGAIGVDSQQALDAAEGLLTPLPVCCMEFF